MNVYIQIQVEKLDGLVASDVIAILHLPVHLLVCSFNTGLICVYILF